MEMDGSDVPFHLKNFQVNQRLIFQGSRVLLYSNSHINYFGALALAPHVGSWCINETNQLLGGFTLLNSDLLVWWLAKKQKYSKK